MLGFTTIGICLTMNKDLNGRYQPTFPEIGTSSTIQSFQHSTLMKTPIHIDASAMKCETLLKGQMSRMLSKVASPEADAAPSAEGITIHKGDI
mmetsp:Transcript_24782/g.43594  ORF Transcript_24782/g.43594 Transcript_24782/m.43594 type:complete len:93 (-) Transcript_24782:12-290(-)